MWRWNRIGPTLSATASSVSAPATTMSSCAASSLAPKLRRQEGNQIELQLDKNTDSIMAVLDALRARGAVITDLSMEGADLEDVFVELTHGGSA